MNATDDCASSAEEIIKQISSHDHLVTTPKHDYSHGPGNVPAAASSSSEASLRSGLTVGDATASMLAVPGLSWLQASVFLVGDVAGSGMLALSFACTLTGFPGPALVLILGIISAYCGLCLSNSWIIIEERQPELAGRCRKPYAEIAARAMGPVAAVFTTVMVNICTLGASIVYVIISSHILAELLATFVSLSYCHWAVIVTVMMTPVSWLGTPADFRCIGIVTLLSSVLTWLLMIIATLVNFSGLNENATHSPPTGVSFFRGLGPILFAFGGAMVFPTLQNDMKDRSQFSWSVALGFFGLISMYVPLAMLGYWAIGDNQKHNYLTTIFERVGGPLPIAALVMFLIHLITAFFVVLNPFFQQMEDIAHVPHTFGIVRIVFRTLIMIILLLLALLIPDFMLVMELIGSTATAATSFILPVIFRLKLELDSRDRVEGERDSPNPARRTKHLPLWEKVLLAVIAVLGVSVAVLSTISAVKSILLHGTGASCFVGGW